MGTNVHKQYRYIKKILSNRNCKMVKRYDIDTYAYDSKVKSFPQKLKNN